MTRSHQPAFSAAIAVMLYAVEMSVLLSALALHKKGTRPLAAFLGASAGHVLIVSLVTLAAAVIIIVYLVRMNAEGARSFWPMLALNLVSVVLMLSTVEVALRTLSSSTPAGPAFANVMLLPKSWPTVAARNRAVLKRAAAQETYLVYDSELGWSIGPNRRSTDYNRAFQERYLARRHEPKVSKRVGADLPDESIYFSSAEGLRSPRADMSFESVPAKRRIALIGDSFTFGLEVRYEQTWGHQLERALGAEFQVLNFGVDGYGVDQAYLRYRRDAVPWHPEIVILGVITDDFRRTMCVFGFLCFPGSEIPFPKPRFVLNGDTLRLLNSPLPAPDSVFTRQSIKELPFIEHDPAFDPAQWEWHFYDQAYSIRMLLSKYPRWSVLGPTVTEEALKHVNAEVLRTFVRTAKSNGSTPVVVFFPSRQALDGKSGALSQGREILRASGIPFLDMTECVAKIRSADRFVVLHYSAATNAAIAQCLQPAILSAAGASRSGPTL